MLFGQATSFLRSIVIARLLFPEDFGLFGRKSKAAMFLIGSGEDAPQLHNPDYDFPDALIETGARVFMRVAHELLG